MNRRLVVSALPLLVLLVALAAVLLGCSSSGGAAAQGDQKPPAAKPGEDKAFGEVVKDMDTLKGVFTFYRKVDENKLLMEILPAQLDTMILAAITIDKSVGERGLYSSQMGSDAVIEFSRVGKTIQMLMVNTTFTADSGTPQLRMTKRSFTHSVLGAAKMQSAPHPTRKSLLIDVAELLLADIPGIAPALNQVYQPTNYRFDKNNSFLGAPKVFPQNALLPLQLHYVTDNPRTPSMTLPDPRSIPIRILVELSMLKKTSYKSRLADDRVGHFTTLRQDYTSDRTNLPDVNYISRWHLEKADSEAALSIPKEPIVFWIENTVPVEYRETIRDGVLLWNKAFEKIGFKDAVVVKVQPDTAAWDPADTRYNTIRWFAGVDAGFAIGPSRVNPFSGEIYDADIGFSESMTRFIKQFGREVVGPVAFDEEPTFTPPPGLRRWGFRHFCSYSQDLVQQAGLAAGVLQVRGELTPAVEEKLVMQFLKEVTCHEVGHTLGLRHNFRASTFLDADQLMDVSITSTQGQSGSVMDYNPYVIATKNETQGDFTPQMLGPYDYWAIEYAYKPIAGDEKAGLAAIASRAPERELTYATDEDALGASPVGIDPLTNQFDQGSDPLKYYRKRAEIVEELWGSVETKLAKSGDGYQVMRRAVNSGLSELFSASLISSKFIGGVYHSRDHVGDPGGRVPYEPVSAAKQREALEFLKKYTFGENTFVIPASLQNKLAINRMPTLDWWTSAFSVTRLDFPWHASVLTIQRAVLDRLFHPIRLARMQDNELRFKPEAPPFTMYDLFREVSGAVWSELDRGSVKVSSLRRNLQREHINQMIRLTLRPPSAGATTGGAAAVRPPEDATTFARTTMKQIQSKIASAMAKTKDGATRAHLDETSERIKATLDARVVRPIE